MKTFLLFLSIVCLLCSCSSGIPAYTRRHPGHHILTTNKKVMRDNVRYQKEHAKAARKKREELARYLDANQVTTQQKHPKKGKD